MKCIEEDPWDARHYVIHSDFALPETIKKMAEFRKRTGYELGLNVQSPIKWTISEFMETVVGPKRAGYHWPLRTMLDSGIRVANSSDAPVIYPDWRPGIQGAVLRESAAPNNVLPYRKRYALITLTAPGLIIRRILKVPSKLVNWPISALLTRIS